MFGFLFGPKDHSKHWQRARNLRLTLDLEFATLNGIGLGERFDQLSFLGPAEDRDALKNSDYGYFSLGLCIGCDEDEPMINSFHLIQSDPCERKYRELPARLKNIFVRLDLQKGRGL